MGSPAALRELRILVHSSLPSTFTNAASTAFNTDNAQKIELTAYAASGLAQDGLEDITLQTRKHAKGAPTVGLSKGTETWSKYFAGCDLALTASPQSELLNVLMGNLRIPSNARSGTAGAGSSSTNITFTSANTYVVAGMAALLGMRGDGRGMGEAKPINAVGVNWIGLSVATNAALSAGDAVVFGDTAYFDESATQQYLETLSIGHATADQRQAVGAGTFGVTMGQNERPTIDVTLTAADHKHVAAGDRAAFTTSAPIGNNPPAFSKAVGIIHLGDHGSPTRTQRMGGDITFDPGLTLEEKLDPAGPNGVGAYVKMPSVPKAEMSLYYDQDMLGLKADYEAGTAKVCLIQLGHVARKTALIEMPKCYIDSLPTDVDGGLNNLMAVRVTVHGTEDFIDGNNLRSSAARIHVF